MRLNRWASRWAAPNQIFGLYKRDKTYLRGVRKERTGKPFARYVAPTTLSCDDAHFARIIQTERDMLCSNNTL